MNSFLDPYSQESCHASARQQSALGGPALHFDHRFVELVPEPVSLLALLLDEPTKRGDGFALFVTAAPTRGIVLFEAAQGFGRELQIIDHRAERARVDRDHGPFFAMSASDRQRMNLRVVPVQKLLARASNIRPTRPEQIEQVLCDGVRLWRGRAGR
jgi:hypothetical protein